MLKHWRMQFSLTSTRWSRQASSSSWSLCSMTQQKTSSKTNLLTLGHDRNSCCRINSQHSRFLPQVDKGDEFGGEAPLLRVAELWRVSSHHLGQLVKHTVPLRVGKPSRGQLILKHIIYIQLRNHERSLNNLSCNLSKNVVGSLCEHNVLLRARKLQSMAQTDSFF